MYGSFWAGLRVGVHDLNRCKGGVCILSKNSQGVFVFMSFHYIHMYRGIFLCSFSSFLVEFCPYLYLYEYCIGFIKIILGLIPHPG